MTRISGAPRFMTSIRSRARARLRSYRRGGKKFALGLATPQLVGARAHPYQGGLEVAAEAVDHVQDAKNLTTQPSDGGEHADSDDTDDENGEQPGHAGDPSGPGGSAT